MQCPTPVPGCSRSGATVRCTDISDKGTRATRYPASDPTEYMPSATQVTYDLNQVAPSDLLALRDTLMKGLVTHQTGLRAIIVQLCLALSGLALQLPQWKDCVKDMIELFGRNPDTVPLLLQFLTVLPDEINSNTRIPITVSLLLIHIANTTNAGAQDDDYRQRSSELLTANSQKVLELLTMYIQAHGDLFHFLHHCSR